MSHIKMIDEEKMSSLTSPQSSPNRRGSSLMKVCFGNTPSP